MKARIVERTESDGELKYVIQTKSWLFGWQDAWLNSIAGAWCHDQFSTLEEAEAKLCYFDGSKPMERVVMEAAE